MKNNNGYDSSIFIVSRERKDIALLPGIGKFCKCDCGKRIEGKKVTRKRNGKKQIYFLRPDPDQVFFNKACKFRFYNKKNSHKSKSSVQCLIQLEVHEGKIPYRELTLYLGPSSKTKFKITPDQKELWNALEKLSRYSGKLQVATV